MVKASKYVGKEVNINNYLKNTDDVLYSKLYIDKDYTGELPDGDSIDSLFEIFRQSNCGGG